MSAENDRRILENEALLKRWGFPVFERRTPVVACDCGAEGEHDACPLD